jgi:hypothetical protein
MPNDPSRFFFELGGDIGVAMSSKDKSSVSTVRFASYLLSFLFPGVVVFVLKVVPGVLREAGVAGGCIGYC